MGPTVLAGAIEFSPAEIAMILAVLAALAVLVTAPGWVVLGLVMGRRVPPAAPPSRRRWARVGGALLGMAVSFGASSLVIALDVGGVVPGVLAAWAACWGVAALLHRSAAVPAERPASTEGWGR